MEILVRCLKSDLAICPVCGSNRIVGVDKESCHCGQCGRMLQVEFVHNVLDHEDEYEEEAFVQMSLFDE